MELLSNLSWIAVAATLWALWLFPRRPTGRGALLPGRGVQLIALAMLSAILLPVISVSDDLQASQNPAEVERFASRSDQHAWPSDGVHPAPMAWSPTIAVAAVAWPQSAALLTGERKPSDLRRGHVRLLRSRPPPVL